MLSVPLTRPASVASVSDALADGVIDANGVNDVVLLQASINRSHKVALFDDSAANVFKASTPRMIFWKKKWVSSNKEA